MEITVSLWPLTSLNHKLSWSRTLQHPMLSTPWEKQKSRSLPRPTELLDSSGWFLKGKMSLFLSDKKRNFRWIPCTLVTVCFPVHSSVSRNSDSLRAGPSGNQNLLEAKFCAPVQTGTGVQPASYAVGTGSFPGVKLHGRFVGYPPPSSAKGIERPELYNYSASGPSCPVLECSRFQYIFHIFHLFIFSSYPTSSFSHVLSFYIFISFLFFLFIVLAHVIFYVLRNVWCIRPMFATCPVPLTLLHSMIRILLEENWKQELITHLVLFGFKVWYSH
jgi:hypothetical protein